jgi:hypothetical protein
VTSFGVALPFMLYGALIAAIRPPWQRLRRNRNVVVLLLSVSVAYTLIHLLSWALVRYRLPVDALLLVFAAIAVVDIGQRVMTALPGLKRFAFALPAGEPRVLAGPAVQKPPN